MTNQVTQTGSNTQYLAVADGRIGYDVQGHGPLMLLLPGMGELRSSYRHLVPRLVDAGFRVATADLRGHGDSDATFSSYGDVETASDIAALVDHLGTPAVVVGNSMSAGSAVIFAARHPELASALALVGPYVRNPVSGSAFQQRLFTIMMSGPWAGVLWRAFVPQLYRGRKPDDFAAYRKSLSAAMRRPGYTKAFRLTTRADHALAEQALAAVAAPSLVVMGAQDPDFADPVAEASWVGAALNGPVQMVEDAGHYPQSQQPEATAEAIIAFLSDVMPDA